MPKTPKPEDIEKLNELISDGENYLGALARFLYRSFFATQTVPDADLNFAKKGLEKRRAQLIASLIKVAKPD